MFFKNFDDFLIDGLYQKLVDKIGINPFELSYYLWGMTMAFSAAIVVTSANYFLIFFVLACALNMQNCVWFQKMKMIANPLRYNLIHMISRTFILLLGILGVLLYLHPIDLFQICMSVFWVSAVYVSCCSVPPPKEIKEKKMFGKEVFQT